MKTKRTDMKPLITVIAAAVILGAVMLALLLGGSQKTTGSTIEAYLTALYRDAKINEATPCLVEAVRQDYYDKMTLFGTTASVLMGYRGEKEYEVGENMKLSVRIDSEKARSASLLSAAEKIYGASAMSDVSFTVTFKGDKGSAAYTGEATLVKISGKWYLIDPEVPLTPVK